MPETPCAPKVLLKTLTSSKLSPGPDLTRIASPDVLLAAKRASRIADVTIRGLVDIEYDASQFFYQICPTQDFEIFCEHARSINLLLQQDLNVRAGSIKKHHQEETALELEPQYSEEAIFIAFFDRYIQHLPDDEIMQDVNAQPEAPVTPGIAYGESKWSAKSDADSDRTKGSEDSNSLLKTDFLYSLKMFLNCAEDTPLATPGPCVSPASISHNSTQLGPTQLRGKNQTSDNKSSSDTHDLLFGPNGDGGDDDDYGDDCGDEVVPIHYIAQPLVAGDIGNDRVVGQNVDNSFMDPDLPSQQTIRESVLPSRQHAGSIDPNTISDSHSVAMSDFPGCSSAPPMASNFSVAVSMSSVHRGVDVKLANIVLPSDDYSDNAAIPLTHPVDAVESHIMFTRATDLGYQQYIQEKGNNYPIFNIGCRAYNHDLDQQRIADNPAFKTAHPFNKHSDPFATLLHPARLPLHLIKITADETTYKEYSRSHQEHKVRFLYRQIIEWKKVKQEMNQALLPSPGMTSVARQAWMDWWQDFQDEIWWLTPDALSARGPVGRNMVVPPWKKMFCRLIDLVIERVDIEEADWDPGFAKYDLIDDREHTSVQPHSSIMTNEHTDLDL